MNEAMWRKVGEIAGWSVLLFVVLPLIVRSAGGTFADGVLVGTGIAIIWYTFETLYLRRETARLRQAASRQIEIMTEQTEAAIRPLLVARIENFTDVGAPHLPYQHFVLRNIGHGPALFIEVQMFTVTVWTKGDWRLEVSRVDLIEPSDKGTPKITPHLVEVQGPVPGYDEIVRSLMPEVHATDNYEITITYEDVQKRRFESVTRMGKDGIRLVSYRML